MGALGNVVLYLALAASVLQVVVATAAGRSRKESTVALAKKTTYAAAALVTLGALVLLAALISRDYSILYVADYTSDTLSLMYRVGAMWAGQGGSLLLWAWMVALAAAWVGYADKKYDYGVPVFSYAVFGLVSGLFVFLSVVLAKVFEASPEGTLSGFGLNPLLQDPLQLIHPLWLYGGYVLYAVPFALVVGALLAGDDFSAPWLRQARNWSIISWICLTGGIVLGARWAYAELGWGGYWAWDPVENASLIPWLTGTALLHNGVLRRGANRIRLAWTVMLMVTFNLCLFGTFLTRSGVIQSVHAFGESSIGPVLGGAILVFILLSGVVVIWRLPSFRFADSEAQNRGWFGQRILAILLFAMTIAVLWGTVYPLFARAINGQEIAVTPGFFRLIVTPMGVAIIGLFAISPFLKGQRKLTWQREAALRSGVFLAVFGGIMLLSEFKNSGVAFVIALSALALITVVQKAIPKIQAARDDEHAIWHAVHAAAPYIGHVGLVVMLMGITVNQAYEVKHSADINLNQTVVVGQQSLRLDKVEIKQYPDRGSFQATVSFLDDSGDPFGSVLTMLEQFNNAEQIQAQVGIYTAWDRDLYVVLDEADATPGSEMVRVTLFDAPGMVWIWVGGLILTLGGIIYGIPWRRRKTATAEIGEAEVGKKLEDRRTVVMAMWIAGAAVVVAAVAVGWAIGQSNSIPGIDPNAVASPSESATTVDPAMIAALEDKVTTNPKDVDSLWALVNIYYPASDWNNAARVTGLLTKADPTNPETWYADASVAQQTKARDRELKGWQQVIKLAPKNENFADVYFNLGFWYWSAEPKQAEKAVAAWKQLIAIAPDSEMAQMVQPHIDSLTASPSPTS